MRAMREVLECESTVTYCLGGLVVMASCVYREGPGFESWSGHLFV